MTLWQPLKWFLDLMRMVMDIEFFPGLTFGAITLGLLAIVLIFRMIIFPLTGGSISSVISGVSRGFDKRRSDRVKSHNKENK